MRACLMLLDLQHGILRSGRIPWETAAIPEAATAAADALVGAARRAGMPIIHVGVVRPLASGRLDQPRTSAAAKSGKVPRQLLPMQRGSQDVAFVIPPADGEEIVHKVGVSAFVGTRAEALLRNLDAQDVLVAGAFTHMAVESTVRHGFDLGFRMAVAADACCAPTKALHDGALSTGIANFASVLAGAAALDALTGRTE